MLKYQFESDVPLALAIAANAEAFRTASDWLVSVATLYGVPVEQIDRLDICLNEALANVLAHGGVSVFMAKIELRFIPPSDDASKKVSLLISDAGRAFDPTSAPVKSRAQSLEDADPGGLGIMMMRMSSDELTYHYANDRNHLTFSVVWA